VKASFFTTETQRTQRNRWRSDRQDLCDDQRT